MCVQDGYLSLFDSCAKWVVWAKAVSSPEDMVMTKVNAGWRGGGLFILSFQFVCDVHSHSLVSCLR